jgi:hypothetical protein
MQRKYSIGLFIGIIILFILFIFAYKISYEKAKENKSEEMEEQRVVDAEICYYIMNLDGYVTVYEGDKKTVFEYTTIKTDDLPEPHKTKVKQGMKVHSLRQVYGFLENYSS